MKTHSLEVAVGKRFEFGVNWRRFLRLLDDKRIAEAVSSIREMLEVTDFEGLDFLDVGCGSGLFSVAARTMGARVHSFDYDPLCVACALELKRTRFPEDHNWVVEQGSALDCDYLRRLGPFDVVLAWGVLHHTGAMWDALENMISLVKPGGTLFLSIYNDQGKLSDFWRMIKRVYNQMPRGLRFTILFPVGLYCLTTVTLSDFIHRRPLRVLTGNTRTRGMSIWTDIIDWVGGYPFEVAKPERVIDLFIGHDFELRKLSTCGGRTGCNQFVLRKKAGK